MTSGSPSSDHRPAARALALYLPQFHPIPENDAWWGPGFTEWTNVAKARPLFRGHRQPKLPGELGFYDLRLAETREAQAELARTHGIEGFVYWHYWFAGKRLLQRPFDEVLSSGRPDLPFALAWANATWSGVWYGEPARVLIEQTYPGLDDYDRHFAHVLPAFRDPRQVRVNGKPLFVVFQPTELPDAGQFVDHWQDLAARNGLEGLYLVAVDHSGDWDPRPSGFDASLYTPITRGFRLKNVPKAQKVLRRAEATPVLGDIVRKRTWRPTHVYDYADVVPHLLPPRNLEYRSLPCVLTNWDNTPRSGIRGSVFRGSTPELFGQHVRDALERLDGTPRDERLLFIKSWNEWAEGNYLEPDAEHGRAYLEALAAVLANGTERSEGH
jgi:lipopolysaccharide biosynthesis protein